MILSGPINLRLKEDYSCHYNKLVLIKWLVSKNRQTLLPVRAMALWVELRHTVQYFKQQSPDLRSFLKHVPFSSCMPCLYLTVLSKNGKKSQKYKKNLLCSRQSHWISVQLLHQLCLKLSSYIHQTQHRVSVCSHSGYLIFSSRPDLQFSHSGWSKHHIDFYWWFLTVIPQATSICLIQLLMFYWS